MTLSEVLPILKELPRAEKLRLIQLLAADVSQEEGIRFGGEKNYYAVWSPSDAFEGAETLLRLLGDKKGPQYKRNIKGDIALLRQS